VSAPPPGDYIRLVRIYADGKETNVIAPGNYVEAEAEVEVPARGTYVLFVRVPYAPGEYLEHQAVFSAEPGVYSTGKLPLGAVPGNAKEGIYGVEVVLYYASSEMYPVSIPGPEEWVELDRASFPISVKTIVRFRFVDVKTSYPTGNYPGHTMQLEYYFVNEGNVPGDCEVRVIDHRGETIYRKQFSEIPPGFEIGPITEYLILPGETGAYKWYIELFNKTTGQVDDRREITVEVVPAPAPPPPAPTPPPPTPPTPPPPTPPTPPPPPPVEKPVEEIVLPLAAGGLAVVVVAAIVIASEVSKEVAR